MKKKAAVVFAVICTVLLVFAGCGGGGNDLSELEAKIAELEAQLRELEQGTVVYNWNNPIAVGVNDFFSIPVDDLFNRYHNRVVQVTGTVLWCWEDEGEWNESYITLQVTKLGYEIVGFYCTFPLGTDLSSVAVGQQVTVKGVAWINPIGPYWNAELGLCRLV